MTSQSLETRHTASNSTRAVDSLRHVAQHELGLLFSEFLQRLPLALVNTGRSAEERRIRSELVRVIPQAAAYWLQQFLQGADTRFSRRTPITSPTPTSPGSGTEESVALATLSLSGEDRHRDLVLELEARISTHAKLRNPGLYFKALAPTGLYRVLQDSADTIEWPTSQRRVLYEQFDALVVARLASLYRALLGALHRLDEASPAAPTEQLPSDPIIPSVRTVASATTSQPSASAAAVSAAPIPVQRPLAVDGKTRTMLRTQAQHASNDSYNDGSLAADLLSLVDSAPLPGKENDPTWAPLQRMTLAGQFFNEAVSDPVIPDELRAQHETMRFPLVKSALADQSFFTAVTHPLRSLVNELMLKSATSRITGNNETRRVAELLQQVLVQFDLAPDFVRQAMQSAQAINETQVRAFFELQRQQAEQRREIVINEAKRLVIRELELHTFGREIPESVIHFLNTAWGPLLAKRLLTHGVNHPQWKSAVGLMQQLLDHLDARPYGDPPSLAWPNLMDCLRQELVAAGSSATHVAAAIAPLEAAHRPVQK